MGVELKTSSGRWTAAEEWPRTPRGKARRRGVSVDSRLDADFIEQLQALPTEIERMDRFRSLALAELAANPKRYLRLCRQRLYFWIWFDLTNPRSYLWHYRICYLTLLASAVCGITLTRRSWSKWAPILVAAAALTMVHVAVITSARFRIPLELLMIPYASVAVVYVLEQLGTVPQ